MRAHQSVCILSCSCPLLPSPPCWRACSCIARKKASKPVPASSGSPNARTKPVRAPLASAMSKLRTADRNCGLPTICCRTSADGGTGRSGGRNGKSVDTSSGCEENKGARFAGVRMSCSKYSVKHDVLGGSNYCWLRRKADLDGFVRPRGHRRGPKSDAGARFAQPRAAG